MALDVAVYLAVIRLIEMIGANTIIQLSVIAEIIAYLIIYMIYKAELDEKFKKKPPR